ncbi:hypothetical protein MKL33_15010 [Acinetobacter sp. AOR43_HL]|uniref:hypothetical protein n=1 Tax=Acinetobacter sp. AOR43_HL TaxID=2919390 RepID=UPI0022EA77C3|nr:hypothetical protein [Acinetobacter sp. AOR43_HL]MDA3451974.1 hypothetical protein [Acinetobacter sp. AOR43_HL]MDA3453137.1 hypothetical protein [Acinetobacter sp. AOR43_HL]
MTELENARIVTELLNSLSPLFIAVFILGLLTGVFFFGRLIDSIDRLGERLRRPKRIRFRNMNGRHERGDSFEYLYLFKGEYFTLEQQQFLKRQALQRLRNKGK